MILKAHLPLAPHLLRDPASGPPPALLAALAFLAGPWLVVSRVAAVVPITARAAAAAGALRESTEVLSMLMCVREAPPARMSSMRPDSAELPSVVSVLRLAAPSTAAARSPLRSLLDTCTACTLVRQLV